MTPSKPIEVFSDGSYDPKINYGSWAALIISDDKEQLRSDVVRNASQHKMELQAVINSLIHISEEYGKSRRIDIFTDSEYVQNLLSRKQKLLASNFISKKGNPIKHAEEIKHFFSLEEQLRITITKVASHQKKGTSRITDLNRRVDKLARKLLKEQRNRLNGSVG